MTDLVLEELVGDELLKSNNEILKVSALSSKIKILGLYFSALWSSPCRTFTSHLINFYNQFKNVDKREDVEIIFVSWDRDEKSYQDYLQTMPWPAVPFNRPEVKKNLKRKFSVHSIPTLIFVDSSTGEILTSHGKDYIISDPQGASFPWSVRNFTDIIQEVKLIDNNGENVSYESLGSVIKGFYFSAHWCPPCRSFTPQLVETYRKIRSAGHRFEVIFVSSDRSHDSFEQYFSSMPWKAIPFEQEKHRKELAFHFDVGGIPTLVLLDEDNSVITKDGRLEVNEDSEGLNFPWRPQLVEILKEKHTSKLNEGICVILFSEGDDKDLKPATAIMQPVAAEMSRNANDKSQVHHLKFYCGGDAQICDFIRDYAQLDDQVPRLIIIDFTEGFKYVFEDDVEITVEVVRNFVQDFLSEKLEPISFIS